MIHRIHFIDDMRESCVELSSMPVDFATLVIAHVKVKLLFGFGRLGEPQLNTWAYAIHSPNSQDQ